jgi:hypothetical protein
LPYRVVVTWLDGKSTTVFTQIDANLPIDAARFAKQALK